MAMGFVDHMGPVPWKRSLLIGFLMRRKTGHHCTKMGTDSTMDPVSTGQRIITQNR